MSKVDIPIILTDEDGFITEINAAGSERIRYNVDELRDLSLISITHERDHQKEVKNAIDLFYGRRQTSLFQKKFIAKGGKILDVFQYVTVLRDNNSDAEFALVIFYPYQENMLNNEILVEKLRQIAGGARLLDFSDAESAYNTRVVSEMSHLVNDLRALMRN